jgi:hypothetical protein
MEDVLVKIKDTTLGRYLEKDLISINELLDALDQAIWEKDELKAEFEEFKQEVEDNYRPVSYAEQVGYNVRDFI